MEVFFQMRFAYCGKPDRILPRQRNKKTQVLDDAQIMRQIELLERVTLPSLAEQTDPSSQLLILTSARMPEDAKDHLNWLLNHHLPGRFRVISARPMIPGRVFRRYMQGLGRGNVPVIQTLLHNGDAFAPGFVQRLREHSIENWSKTPERRGGRGGDGTFLSFRRGWRLGMKHKSIIGLEQCSNPAKPFALSLAARPSSRFNPLLVNPDALGTKVPHVSVMTQEVHCLRTVRGSAAEAIGPIEHRQLEEAAKTFAVLRQGHKIAVKEDRILSAPVDVSGAIGLRRTG